MSNITAYPLQDWFETTLAQSWNGAIGTVYLNTAPSFTFPSGVKTYIVVNPWKTNMQVGEIDSLHVWNKTVNVSSISVGSWAGTTYTQESHSVWSTVIISDNYQFWKNIVDAVNSKIDLSGGTFTGDVSFSWTGTEFRLPNLTTAERLALTPWNGTIVYDSTLWENYQYIAWAWNAFAAWSTQPNASTTVAGKVEIATTAESTAGTDTGGTWALLSVLPSDIAKNTQSSTFIYWEDVGGDDTYVVALTPVLAAYTTWQTLQFKVTTANTGACTVDFWPWAKSIKTLDGNDPQTGAIRAGMIVTVKYDGTNFVLSSDDIASDTSKGIVELATSAETITGTSTTLAVTPAWYKAAVTQALVGWDYDKQYQVFWISDSTTSVINASASSGIDFSGTTWTTQDFSSYRGTWDFYIYSLVWGKPWTANKNLRWDDISVLEIEFTFASDSSLWAWLWQFVGIADSSATTAWTDDTSIQRKVLFAAGNGTTASAVTMSSDGTTTSSSSTYATTTTSWNKYKLVFNKGTNILTYVNGTLADTKTTNLPSGTNLVTIGIWQDSTTTEIIYITPITVRVKYA